LRPRKPRPDQRLNRGEPIAQELYAALRKDIISGALRPDDGLSEARIAEQFGVSRTPVREVFSRLSEEGFLRIRPQVGTFVAPIRLDAVRDGQFIRETLECRTVALAAERATAADAARLKQQLRAQEALVRAGDLQGFFAADDALHADLIRIAGRPFVWRVIQEVKAQLDRVRYLSLESGDWLRRMIAQHEAIVARVLDHDAAGAEAAMCEHLQTVIAAVERISASNADFFEAPDDTSDRRRPQPIASKES
jgi:DNA-binding GntR family transcriptional regulator